MMMTAVSFMHSEYVNGLVIGKDKSWPFYMQCKFYNQKIKTCINVNSRKNKHTCAE